MSDDRVVLATEELLLATGSCQFELRGLISSLRICPDPVHQPNSCDRRIVLRVRLHLDLRYRNFKQRAHDKMRRFVMGNEIEWGGAL